MIKKEIKVAEKEEKQSFIFFIISLISLFISILVFIPFEYLKTFFIGLIATILIVFVVGSPVFLFTTWINNKHYTKSLKRLYGEYDNDR